ncbi:hypothetical protein AVEN_61559-1 [Araneus ventricosus]|uniref:Uncharacterized protein n=1 Tax=Araneus ventricosus TaxID=182803 RepID=A0A4Y2MH87_ARAVE|nr:hypothetical protein AVEN_61559-1 [Araneus ventricosus]
MTNLTRGDFEACINVLQTCFKLTDLQSKIAAILFQAYRFAEQDCCKLVSSLQICRARLLQTKIAIWVTTRQTCHKLIANYSKTEYEDNLGFEPLTSRFLNLSSYPLSQLDSGRRR